MMEESGIETTPPTTPPPPPSVASAVSPPPLTIGLTSPMSLPSTTGGISTFSMEGFSTPTPMPPMGAMTASTPCPRFSPHSAPPSAPP
ncbi:hypothetical protein AALO_G00167990 [Alosa alosa]|nr:hypothetical protein AALO_G00167990 [Alosa alosa]